MKSARRARSGRQSAKSRPTESAAVATIAAAIATTSPSPSGRVEVTAANAPKVIRSP